MEEREDMMEDVARQGIRIGRVYAKYGLNLAAVWVEYGGKILEEVAQMLRGNAEVLGGAVHLTDSSAGPRSSPPAPDGVGGS